MLAAVGSTIARCGRCAVATGTRCRRRPCCGACGRGLLPPAAGCVRHRGPPARIRCSVWTSVSSRPPPLAGRGVSRIAGTTGANTSIPGMCRRRRTSTNAITAIEARFGRLRAVVRPPAGRNVPTRARPWSRARGDDRDLAAARSGRSASRRSSPHTPNCATSVPESGRRARTARARTRFRSLKYERLFLEEIDDVLAVVKHADAYRVEHNTVRPHEAIAWDRPIQIHPGLVGPRIPTFPETENLPTT